MILLKKLQLHNFLSHQQTDITFDDKDIRLINGKSGSGKSSLVDALTWALFNQSRTDNQSLIRKGENEASVIVVLFDEKENKEYKIERTINSKNKSEFKISEKIDKVFKPIKISGKRGLQEHLEKNIICCSYILFVNSVVYEQENVNSFVKQTAVKRKDIILEIIKASDFDDYLEKTKTLLLQERSQFDIMSSKKEQYNSLLVSDKLSASQLPLYQQESDRLTIELSKVEQEITDISAEQSKLNEQKIIIANNESRALEIKNRISKNDFLSKTLNQKIISLQSVDDIKIRIEIENLKNTKTEISLLEKQKEDYDKWSKEHYEARIRQPNPINFDYTIQSLNKQLIDISREKIEECSELHKPCPIIAQKQAERMRLIESQLNVAINDKNAQDKRLEGFKQAILAVEGRRPTQIDDNRLKQLKIAYEKIVLFERELAKLENRDSEIKSISDELLLIQAEQIGYKSDLEKYEKDLEYRIVIESNERELFKNKLVFENNKIELNVKKTSNTKMLTIAEEATKRVIEYTTAIDKIDQDTTKNRQNVESLELLKDAFGNNGIKAIMIDFVIPKLEEKINNILGKLSDFRVQLETQKSGVSKETVIEGLFINIINGEGEVLSYDSYSGGEKQKITCAIQEALSTMSKMGFRILDETFVSLDEESTEKFVDIIKMIQERLSQIFVISHLRNIKDMFEKKIEIVKINGISYIVGQSSASSSVPLYTRYKSITNNNLL